MLSEQFRKLNTSIQMAGNILLNYFGQQLHFDHKSTSADYRTKADVETENAIIEAIEEIFPDYNIFAEECGEKNKGSEYTFVIDPLDGTNNFILGIPVFTSSVALMKGTETVYGMVHCPMTRDIYYAIKGKGAFLNDQLISVNKEDRPSHMTVSYYCNYITPKEQIAKFKSTLFGLGIKRCLDLWSPAFCYCNLASGRIEAIINDKIELYDFAAGKLIAIEAGAIVTDFSGNKLQDDKCDQFIITNDTDIHNFLVENVTGS